VHCIERQEISFRSRIDQIRSHAHPLVVILDNRFLQEYGAVKRRRAGQEATNAGPLISGSRRIADAHNNVRYQGQSGDYMLTESFTARDPKRTSNFNGVGRGPSQRPDPRKSISLRPEPAAIRFWVDLSSVAKATAFDGKIDAC
jgi:hypothetical protein